MFCSLDQRHCNNSVSGWTKGRPVKESRNPLNYEAAPCCGTNLMFTFPTCHPLPILIPSSPRAGAGQKLQAGVFQRDVISRCAQLRYQRSFETGCQEWDVKTDCTVLLHRGGKYNRGETDSDRLNGTY